VSEKHLAERLMYPLPDGWQDDPEQVAALKEIWPKIITKNKELIDEEIASLRAQLAKMEAEKEAGGFWAGVFDDIADKTDREKIEAELSDYHFVMQQVPDVYMHITGGKMSKCNYYAHAVIAEADEYSEKFTNEAADEARCKAIEECALLARSCSDELVRSGHGGDAAAEALDEVVDRIRALLSESKT
jgi:hypothetical protein